MNTSFRKSIPMSWWIGGGVLALGILLVALFAFFDAYPSTLSESQSDLVKVTNDAWVRGNPDAPVTLVEYLDFQCPACGTYYSLVKQLESEFPDALKVVTRHFPLVKIHPNAMAAARSAEAAGKQGKFWEMHDKLYENQKEWSGLSPSAVVTTFKSYAESIGVNPDQFARDLKDNALDARITADQKSGEDLGVAGTPTFFLNGEKLQNPRSYEDFKTLVQAALLKSPVVQNKSETKKVHEHIDLKVYLEGKPLDLSLAKYQSTEESPLDPGTHLHDGNGNTVHKHSSGITLGYFFQTLKLEFTKECFVLDTGNRFCNDGDKKLRFFVNDTESPLFGGYVLNDLDSLLITYGSSSDAEIQKQLASVTDDACVYSEKCPERGKPPTENCIGGLGTECTPGDQK